MSTIQGRWDSEGVTQVSLRMPVAFHLELKAEARSLGRSLNTHIVMRLSEGGKAAAGGEIAVQAPAAGSEAVTLQGDTSHTLTEGTYQHA